ncbi:hypothetical protein V8E54_011938 [Elaphomyces granulatus]
MAITEEPVLRLFDSEAKETIAKINASGKGLGAVLKDKPGKEYMIVYSETVETFQERWSRLISDYQGQRELITYLQMKFEKRKGFVRAWTSEVCHFSNITTSRCEGGHQNALEKVTQQMVSFKKSLRTANSKLTANDFHSFYHFERIHKTNILKSARPPPPGPTIPPPNVVFRSRGREENPSLTRRPGNLGVMATPATPNDMATAVVTPGNAFNPIPIDLNDPDTTNTDYVDRSYSTYGAPSEL